MNNYADAFNTYLATGLGGPLPLRPGTKIPPPTGWTGWDAKYPSWADCESWAHHVPEYTCTTQLGIRLVSGAVGLDWDMYDDKKGRATRARAIELYGPLPEGPYSTSRDDGWHIQLFQLPPGTILVTKLAVQQADGTWTGDTEVIQHHHRYVVAAPSIHPKTGQPYLWHNTAGVLVPPKLDELPWLPERWLEAMQGIGEDAERADDEQVAELLATFPDGPMCQAVTTRLAEARRAIDEDGSRHDTTRDNVLALLRLGEQGHTGAHTALGLLETKFVEARLADASDTRRGAIAEYERLKCGPRGVGLILANPTPLMDKGCCGPDDIEVCILNQPSATPTEPETQPAPEQAPTAFDPALIARLADALNVLAQYDQAVAGDILKERKRREVKRIVDAEEMGQPEPPSSESLADLLAEPDDPEQWRVHELWPSEGKTLVVAPKKAGKTTLVGNLIRSLADGTPFLGAPPCGPGLITPGHLGFGTTQLTGRIVVFDFEMTRKQLKRWLRKHGVQNRAAVHVKFMRGKVWDIRDKRIRAMWADYLRSISAEIIGVDPLVTAMAPLGIDENSNTEVGGFLHALDALVTECGARELLVSHHAGKGREDGRGASVIEGWPDAIWRIVKEEDRPGAARFFSAEGRDVELWEQKLEFDPDTKRLWLGNGNRTTHAVDKHAAPVVTYIAENPGQTQNKIKEAFRGNGGGTEKIVKVLKSLIETGSVHTHDGANKSKLHYVGERCADGCGPVTTAANEDIEEASDAA